MKPICFYNHTDTQSIIAALIVKHFEPECELKGMDYGDKIQWDKVRPGPYAETDPTWAESFKKRLVFMVGYDLVPDDMKELCKISRLLWIDNNPIAIDTAIALGYSTTKGGCAGLQCRTRSVSELTLRYFLAMQKYDEYKDKPEQWAKYMMELPIGNKAISLQDAPGLTINLNPIEDTPW